jgi:hypothetical protein
MLSCAAAAHKVEAHAAVPREGECGACVLKRVVTEDHKDYKAPL